MTPAEYRTIAESLGISQLFLAQHTGLSEGRVWSFGSPGRKIDVPDHAASALTSLAVEFDEALAMLLAEHDGDQRPLVRHTTPEAFWQAHPLLIGWPLAAEGMLLAAAMAATKGALGVVYA